MAPFGPTSRLLGTVFFIAVQVFMSLMLGNRYRCLIECREEYRYNIEAVDCLIRTGLVSMPQYDMHLAQSMENGLNYMAVAFAMQLVQRFCIDEKHDATNEVCIELNIYTSLQLTVLLTAK
jgi:hypothetical protein